MRGAVTILIGAVAAVLAAAAQDQASWTLGGSLVTRPSVDYGAAGPLDSSDFTYGSSTALELDLRAGSPRARMEASLQAAVLAGSAAGLAWAVAASPFGRPDDLLVPASPPASGDETALLSLRARTLYLKLDFDRASLTAGRQVVNYGRGVLWSPVDVFTELDLAGLTPERLGSDALRLLIPFGATGGLDAVAAPTLSPGEGRYAVRLTGLLWGVDAAVVAARNGSGGGWITGADFKADLGVGLYGEAVYEVPDTGDAGTVRASGGVDWSSGDFVVTAEYYYNGGGASRDRLFPQTHNLYGSAGWRLTPLLEISGAGIWDPVNAEGTASLLVTASVAQNASVAAYLQGGNGEGGYGVGYGLDGAGWNARAGVSIEVRF